MTEYEQQVENIFQFVVTNAMASGLVLTQATLNESAINRASETDLADRYGISLCQRHGRYRLGIDIRLTGRSREVAVRIDDGHERRTTTTSVDLLIVRWRAIVDELLVEQQRKARDLEAALGDMRRRIVPPKEDGGA